MKKIILKGHLKFYLKKFLTIMNNPIDKYGLFQERRSFLQGRRLYKQWQQQGISSIPEMDILRLILNSDDIVFDIGANIGEFTFFLSTIVSDGLIYAFEPQKKPFKMLRAVSMNMKAVVPNNKGFSSSTGETTLFIPIVEGFVSHTEASLDPRFNDYSGYERRTKSKNSIQETIRLTTLDDFCETNFLDRLDFIKVDVEGHELEILNGGSRICLRKYRPIMLIEIFPYVYQGHFENVCKFFKFHDYRGFVISKSKDRVEPLTKINLKNSQGFNYFFVPQEKTSEFLYRIESKSMQ